MPNWYSLPSGPERQAAKAAAQDGTRRLRNLARKHGLHVGNVRATLTDDKLILSNGVSEFALTLTLIDKPYLEHTLNALHRDCESPTPPDRSGPAAADV